MPSKKASHHFGFLYTRRHVPEPAVLENVDEAASGVVVRVGFRSDRTGIKRDSWGIKSAARIRRSLWSYY
jgi:hypothetical protein